MGYYRNLHIGTKIWQCHVGRDVVNIKTPQGKRINVDCSVISGIIDWQRAREDRNAKILPQMVKNFIQDNFNCPLCVAGV